MHLVRDGVKLAYEEAGSGSPIVFIHGWCGNRSFFEPQITHFSRAHRCVSVDLRGHGESDAPRQEYSIAGFADDLAWLCGALGIEKPLVVGHSMGGAVALSLSVRHPDLPSGIVMLDGAIVRPAALLEHWPEISAAFHSDAHDAMLRQIGAGMFMATDTVRTQEIVDGMLAAPKHVVMEVWDAMGEYDSISDARQCAVPALYVGSADPVADMAQLRELMPHVVLAQTAGAGHFHQLEVPEQVNAMIERFVAINGGWPG